MKKIVIILLGLIASVMMMFACLCSLWFHFTPTPIVGSIIANKQGDMKKDVESWFKDFFHQYVGWDVPFRYRIRDYKIHSITVLNQKNMDVQVDYQVKPVSENLQFEAYYEGYGGKDGWYDVQMVLQLKGTPSGYEVKNKLTPVQYQIQTDPSLREPQTQHYAMADREDTYFFDKQQLYVTYDKGKTTHKVPVSYEDAAGSDNGTYNELLPEHGYCISKAFTAFVFYDEKGSYLLYTSDEGTTWRRSRILGVNYRGSKVYLEKTNTGCYVTLATDRSLGHEYYTTLKTTDYKTWTQLTGEMFNDAQTVVFLDNHVGYIAAGKDSQNNILVKFTQDDGKHYQTIVIPAQPVSFMNSTIYPFVNMEYVYQDKDVTYMVVRQGQDGDYSKNNILAKALYKSVDKTTFTYVKELYDAPTLAG